MATQVGERSVGASVKRRLRHGQTRLACVTAPAQFLLRNLWGARRLMPIEQAAYGTLRLCGMRPTFLPQVDALYHAFADGRHLEPAMWCMLRLLGRRLCVTAVDPADRVVAVGIYYFNARDLREGSIHGGYSAVIAEAQRRGIGTAMRRHALKHFARCGLRGVSARITMTNTGSRKIAERLGFEVRDHYFDEAMGQRRAYLWCDLARHRSPSR